ncbi:MAG: hypothetical protein GXO77_16220 [Calditrichaeota bacterium]|nr:hypothetical protein [Calditrichota bacterium]
MRKLMLFWLIAFVFLVISKSFSQPAANPDPLRFEKEINSFVQYDKKNSFPSEAVLFVGSSSIRMWRTHDDFPEYPVINRGFGGAHISDVLYYYNEVIKKYNPAIIVFYAGDNDIAAGKSVKQVFNDYQALIKKILNDFTNVKFIYIPIKPSVSRWKFWDKMHEVNQLIKKYNEKHKKLYYADLATPLLNAEGKPDENLFIEDGLHLNQNGYARWKKELQPLLKELWLNLRPRKKDR